MDILNIQMIYICKSSDAQRAMTFLFSKNITHYSLIALLYSTTFIWKCRFYTLSEKCLLCEMAMLRSQRLGRTRILKTILTGTFACASNRKNRASSKCTTRNRQQWDSKLVLNLARRDHGAAANDNTGPTDLSLLKFVIVHLVSHGACRVH